MLGPNPQIAGLGPADFLTPGMNIIVLLREQSLTYEQSITYSPLSEIFQILGSDELCPHLKIQTLSSFLSWQLRQCKFVELLQRGQVTQFC